MSALGVDFTSIASALSTAFAVSIALQSYIVYRRTEREHFLSLAVGFALLSISFALLVPLAFGIKLPTVGYESTDILVYPPRIVISAIALVIIALSYSTRMRVKRILYGLIVLLAILVAAVMDSQLASVPYSVDGLLYALHIGLLSFVLYQMWRVSRPIQSVTLGFAILLASQCVALVDSIHTDAITFLLSQAVRLAALALLVIALIQVNRPRLIEPPEFPTAKPESEG